MRDVDRPRDTEVELHGKRFAVGTRACGEAGRDRELRGARLPSAVSREEGGRLEPVRSEREVEPMEAA